MCSNGTKFTELDPDYYTICETVSSNSFGNVLLYHHLVDKNVIFFYRKKKDLNIIFVGVVVVDVF
jgi:hypothetical protein